MDHDVVSRLRNPDRPERPDQAPTRPEKDTLRHEDQKAHVLREWWRAENSDGFHNPAMACESLRRSVEESRKGIKLIGDTLEKKTTSK